MSKFSTFIFDIDGTIGHTNELIFESFRHISKKYLGRNVSDEEIISLFGPTEDIILKEWMKDDYDIARKDYFDFYTSHHSELAKATNGIEDVFKLIEDHNLNLAIFTGKGKDSTKITLEQFGFDKYFSFIVSGDDVVNHKPSPDGLNKIVDHFGISTKEALMIGDSPHDVKAAQDANIKIASVLWDCYAEEEVISMNPDYIFKTVNDFNIFIEAALKNQVDK